MDCKDIEEYLIPYAEDTINESLKSKIREHLPNCETCQKELSEIQFLFEAFSKVEDIKPSEKLRDDFYDMLAREKQRQPKVVALQQVPGFKWKWVVQIAATVVLVLMSFFFGKFQENQAGQKKLEALTVEKKEIKKSMMLAMIETKSASTRVLGINYIEELSGADIEIIQALIDRMDNDENTNVRLAAVEVLGKFSESELVRKALINALEYQEVAEVQIAIIQILGNFKEQRAIKPMEKLLKKEEVPSYVKDQIRLQLPNLV